MDMKNPYIIDVKGLTLENCISFEDFEEEKVPSIETPSDTVQNISFSLGTGDTADASDIEATLAKSEVPFSKADYPFEFTKTKLWSESFFDESENSNAISTLLQEVGEIKQLVTEIRSLLPSFDNV